MSYLLLHCHVGGNLVASTVYFSALRITMGLKLRPSRYSLFLWAFVLALVGRMTAATFAFLFVVLFLCTLVYRIDVHARLLILRKKSPLYGLISVCTFIYFEKKLPPARLFHPACLLVLVCSKFHSTHDPEQSIPQHCQSNPKAIPKQSQIILKYSKVSQSIPTHPKVSQSSNGKKLPPQNSPLHSLILLLYLILPLKILVVDKRNALGS